MNSGTLRLSFKGRNLFDESNETDLEQILEDLPRGRHAEFVGRPPSAYFESPANITATTSLNFDTEHNRESKIFLGTLGGRVISGDRLPDGRPIRWVEGGVPIGVGVDRHVFTLAGSRAGKGRSALMTNLALLPATTSIFCIDPKGDLCLLYTSPSPRDQRGARMPSSA